MSDVSNAALIQPGYRSGVRSTGIFSSADNMIIVNMRGINSLNPEVIVAERILFYP